MKSLHHTFILIGIAVSSLLGMTSTSSAFNENPTPYDPENYTPTTLAPRSTSQYFILDAKLPKEWMGAFDQRQALGVTGFFVGGLKSGNSNTSQISINSNDISLMQQPERVCSAYAEDMCFHVGKFYESRLPQAGMTGLFALNGSTMIQWGFNTGYDSDKLTVSPSVLVGLAKRFFLSESRDSHVIIEASEWIGGTVKHRPRIDDFNRQYFCGAVSAWSDFSYDAHPRSAFMKLTYEKLF